MTSSRFLLAFYLTFYARLIACLFDFSVYPLCAQQPLLDNAPSSCDYGSDELDIATTDNCLCSDNAFLQGAAAEIYTSCGCEVLSTSASLLSAACNLYAPGALLFSVAQIMSAGDGGQAVCANPSAASTSAAPVAGNSATDVPTSTQATTVDAVTSSYTTPTSPSTTSSTPSSNNGNGGGGGGGGGGGNTQGSGGAGATIAIIASVCTIVTTAIAIWGCLCYRKHRYRPLGQ
jgi:uncharacterized membrane protein YgcG